MKQLIVATKNNGKADEFKTFFKAYPIKVLSLLDLPEAVPDIDETGTTFEANAAIKAEEIAARMQIPVLADDSGLVIDALNGKPGVYSARYAGEPTDDQKNITKVLEELTGITIEKRGARFVCVLAIAAPYKGTVFYHGTCDGTIALEPKGENGFGYDPIFTPKGYQQTMAELDPSVKNEISHRSRAINDLKADIPSVLKHIGSE